MTNDKRKFTPPPGPSEPASPVCYASAMNAAYGGYLDEVALIALLNSLLEGERAGDKALVRFAADCPDPNAKPLLQRIGRDEARFAALLERLIGERCGTPSPRVGAFYDKAVAVEGLAAQLAFLNRGQAWVVDKLTEALPRIRDDRIHAALKGMLGAHEANIARCEALIETLG